MKMLLPHALLLAGFLFKPSAELAALPDRHTFEFMRASAQEADGSGGPEEHFRISPRGLEWIVDADADPSVPKDVPKEMPKGEPKEKPPPILTLRASGWGIDPSGWMLITRASKSGSATRAREGRNYFLDPGPAGFLEGQLRVWGPHAFGLRASWLSSSGTGRSSSDFVYHGTLYGSGRRVRTDLSLQIADLDYQLVLQPLQNLTLTAHLGLEYWRFGSRIKTVDSLPAIDESRAFSSAFWLTGIDARFDPIEPIFIRASVLGGFEGTSRWFGDGEVSIGVHLYSAISAVAGYRIHALRFHLGTNEAFLLDHGPWLGIEISL